MELLFNRAQCKWLTFICFPYLDRTNPIGMRGHMAKCYGDLVQELWSGTQKNIAPLKLRVGTFVSCHLYLPEKFFLFTLSTQTKLGVIFHVVDDSKVCTEIQWLPAAGLSRTAGILVGRVAWGPESGPREALCGAEGQRWTARCRSGYWGQCQAVSHFHGLLSPFAELSVRERLTAWLKEISENHSVSYKLLEG